jgi:hypothetical protein
MQNWTINLPTDWSISNLMFDHVIWSLNQAEAVSLSCLIRQHRVVITAACVPNAKPDITNIRN